MLDKSQGFCLCHAVDDLKHAGLKAHILSNQVEGRIGCDWQGKDRLPGSRLP